MHVWHVYINWINYQLYDNFSKLMHICHTCIKWVSTTIKDTLKSQKNDILKDCLKSTHLLDINEKNDTSKDSIIDINEENDTPKDSIILRVYTKFMNKKIWEKKKVA